MTKLCVLLNKSEDELFQEITSSFKNKITQWNYFVNWQKVLTNIEPIEKELNLLNVLIGKTNLENEFYKLVSAYPAVVKAIPILLAIRANSLEVLIDTKKFIYSNFDFTQPPSSPVEAKLFSDFIINTGLGDLLKDKRLKNLVDYATGVEVGLDSNGRKNRGGSLMESLVEDFVSETCCALNLTYLPQATAKKIKNKWGLEIKVDKSSRIIDFVINKNNQLYFIEVNFYGGGGSKLKSTASEYAGMYKYWKDQGINFIWVTDGAGWQSTLKPLREYFDKAEFLLNLELLKQGVLTKILK